MAAMENVALCQKRDIINPRWNRIILPDSNVPGEYISTDDRSMTAAGLSER